VSGNVNNAAFYNNLFICGAGEYASNGMITMGSYLASTFRIYNNTFVNNTGGGNSIDISGSSVAQTLDVKNNLGYSLGSGTFIAAYSNANLTVTSDYNLVYGYSSTPFVYSSTSSGVFLNVANWKTATRGDTHTLTSNPNLSSTYQLQSGSPAIDAGTSEAAYFTTDKNGVTRPQGSAWDIGAFEFVSGSSTLSAPAGLKLVE
jgi:hypothetical protein